MPTNYGNGQKSHTSHNITKDFLMLNLRKLHRKIAPILFIPLLLSATTGIAYRIGRSWFGLSDEFGDFMMLFHEGRFLGKPLVPVYVLLLGLGLLGIIVSGLTMIKRKRQSSSSQPQRDIRWLHRFLAPIAFLPLLVSSLTGISYRLGKVWFGLPQEQAAVLLKIHQGSYLGSTLKPLYVLLVGAGLISLLITGIQMSGIFRKHKPQSSSSSS
ncbi:MAG: PepSY domain-containing protein [Nodularia sp. (in: cyanobacteria)]|nr:PepSY domain-containing protein [Nodularia sp. (in: cyanobacteria)]